MEPTGSSTPSLDQQPLQQPTAAPQMSIPKNSFNRVQVILMGLFILAVVACVSYVLGMVSQKSSDMAVNPYLKAVATPVISKTIPTSTPDPTQNLKVYTDPHNIYSFSYPSTWYAKEVNNPTPCVSFSDIPNPPSEASPHQLLNVCYLGEPVPTTFPYDNGQSDNPTITALTVNGYTGIKGKEFSADGLSELVFLKDPNGTYPRNGLVNLTLWQSNNENILNQILATFKFTQ